MGFVHFLFFYVSFFFFCTLKRPRHKVFHLPLCLPFWQTSGLVIYIVNVGKLGAVLGGDLEGQLTLHFTVFCAQALLVANIRSTRKHWLAAHAPRFNISKFKNPRTQHTRVHSKVCQRKR